MLRALDLAEAIEQEDMTASTVIELCAEAIAAREGEVHAFAHLMLDQARLTAARAGATKGPLKGLPIGVKDIIDTADAPTAMGSSIYEGWQPRADASVVRMIRAASGIILGKTVTTEFAQLNPPPTANPHNLLCTPGGSSSGSAAAVAAGMLPLAIGTQTGGSIIRPAAFCGVAAIKPSFNLLPRIGMKAFAWSFDTVGLFAARVVDVAFGLAAITGRPFGIDEADRGALRVGVFHQAFAGDAAPEAAAALETARRAFERAGASITDFTAPGEFAKAHAIHSTINNYEAAHALAWERETHRDQLSAILIQALDEGAATPITAYDAARSVAKRARRAAKQAFETHDLLLTYAAQGAAPDRSSTGDSTFNKLFSLLGTPCIHVPVMKTPEGLPVGVQAVAAFGRDDLALAGAAVLEAALARTG